MSNGFEGTKGPWEFHALAHSAVIGADRVLVANCGGHADNRRDEDELIAEQNANARLIIEAGNVANETGLTPRQLAEQRAELLSACERLLSDFKGVIARRVVRSADETIAEAEAAVARATGGES